MTAGLQGHIDRRTPGVAGEIEGIDFGMGFPGAIVIALGEHLAVRARSHSPPGGWHGGVKDLDWPGQAPGS